MGRTFIFGTGLRSSGSNAPVVVVEPSNRDIPEPKPEPPAIKEIWVLEVDGFIPCWSTDRNVLDRLVVKRGYEHAEGGTSRVYKLKGSRTHEAYVESIGSEWIDKSVYALDMKAATAQWFCNHGVHFVREAVEMTIADFKKKGIPPKSVRVLGIALKKVGLSLSFDLYPGEVNGWSPKRKQAETAA
jgi:hypothetical protein